jgi:hypothetical protein
MKMFKNNEIKKIISETVDKFLLKEYNSVLYHFICFDFFKEIVKTNSFKVMENEKEYNNGLNSLSFSRTKSFREGFPTLFYDEFEGWSDNWCKIRLTIDGEELKKNPKVKLKPFDYPYNSYTKQNFDISNEFNLSKKVYNGKEWMMNSVIQQDKFSHPYSQAEERLTTKIDKINNALKYILRIDILIEKDNFNENNQEQRRDLRKIFMFEDSPALDIFLYGRMRYELLTRAAEQKTNQLF